jgi:4-hydroxyphenylpyruvate dioxygenase
MRALGFQPLDVPANYYDDVEARFGLDPDLMDRLKAQNVLYDRDEGGEYMQFYSRNYGEGFFFEIVQRRSAYVGYGAFNAPVRIASQKRALNIDGQSSITVF